MRGGVAGARADHCERPRDPDDEHVAQGLAEDLAAAAQRLTQRRTSHLVRSAEHTSRPEPPSALSRPETTDEDVGARVTDEEVVPAASLEVVPRGLAGEVAQVVQRRSTEETLSSPASARTRGPARVGPGPVVAAGPESSSTEPGHDLGVLETGRLGRDALRCLPASRRPRRRSKTHLLAQHGDAELVASAAAVERR